MPVVVERPAEGVTVVRLDDPAVRNAVSVEAAERLADVFEECMREPGTDALVVTGTDPAFSAGIDMRDIAAGRRVPLRFIERLARMPAPTIAAVNGVAATGGLELALACDIRIGSSRARFVDRHVQLGLAPGAGMTARLPRLIGLSRALEMSLAGRMVEAEEAHRLGLVDRLVEHDRLLDEAVELARTFAGLDADLVRRVLPLYRGSPEGTLDDALARERAAADEWREHRDHSSVVERFKGVRRDADA